MDWAASDLDDRTLYKLLVNTVLPRPIALVTTVDADGAMNAAPFSFFNVFSHAPPLVVLGIEGRDDPAPLKDTMANIRHTGSFVVNLVDRALVEAITLCAVDLPREIDELREADLTPRPARRVAAPLIEQSPVQFECRETVSLSLGTRNRNLVVGEIIHLHIRDGLVDERYHVDIDALDLVGRLHGADWYVTTHDRFQVPRISLDEWNAGREHAGKETKR
jgi:flavin reductase (DIM6/NTAB) family NADH-FMN oxidoreductase RutF